MLLIFFKYHSYIIDIDSVKILTVSTIATRLLHVPFDTHFFPPQLLSRVRLFATPWTAAHQASLSITNSQSLLKLLPIESVMPSNHLILCHPLLPPSFFPSIRVFSNESVLHIRWPKYWSFSFNISPSSEYSGLISFRMDWLDLLAVQGTLKSLPPTHSVEVLSLTLPPVNHILSPSTSFLIYSRHAPTPGPLHLLFPPLQKHFLQISTWFHLQLLQIFTRVTFLDKFSLEILSKIQYSNFSCLPLLFIFILSFYQ